MLVYSLVKLQMSVLKFLQATEISMKNLSCLLSLKLNSLQNDVDAYLTSKN